MLCLMHNGIPYGHLTMNGKVVLEGTLAKIVGASEEEVKVYINELESVGVFSRTEEGVIYSRRMVEDERLRQVRAAGGFKALDNPNVPRPKLDVEGIPSTDTIDEYHEPIPSSSSSSSSSSSEEKQKRSRSTSERSRRSQVCDEEFLEELQNKPAYQGINVKRLYDKMVVWCEMKGKQPTRLRLINWLNREDIPMGTKNGQSVQQPRKAVF